MIVSMKDFRERIIKAVMNDLNQDVVIIADLEKENLVRFSFGDSKGFNHRIFSKEANGFNR